jgi:predicted nucleic acid-binding protein
MVVIDATILLLFFRPDAGVPAGPRGRTIDFPRERIEFPIQQLEKARTKIVIPTPVLSELLVRAGPAASQEIVEEVNRLAVFRIEPFDARAAIEVAAMTRATLAGTGKKRGASKSPWAKIKFDRQIVATAKVVGATMIYSDDRDVIAIAKAEGIPVMGLADLPVPDRARQGELFTHAETIEESAPDSEPVEDA